MLVDGADTVAVEHAPLIEPGAHLGPLRELDRLAGWIVKPNLGNKEVQIVKS